MAGFVRIFHGIPDIFYDVFHNSIRGVDDGYESGNALLPADRQDFCKQEFS